MGRMITKEQIEALKPYILENAPAIIAVHDLDHNILWANKAYRDATGLSLKRVEGKKCYHAWGLDRFCKGCPVSKAMRTDKKQEAELTPQNQKHWPADQGSWLAKATPIKDEQGQIIGAIEIAHDITATMDAVEALRKTELRYQDLYDNAPDMFVSVDAKTSKILECNRTFLKKTGYKKKEIIGEQIFSVYHPDSLEGAHKAFKSFVTTGKVSDAELQLKKKNGSKIDVSLNVSAVRDKKNRILQSRSVWRDITELKKAEKKISDLAKFPEENPDPVFRVSKDGKVLYSNVAGVKMILTGWGSKIGEFVPERWRRFAKDALTNKKRIVEEESFEDKTFLFTITPVSEEHYVNIYVRDITELKEVEKVKYNIMRDVSHSIKTPLAVSRMANEILKNAINTKDIEKAKMAHDMLHKGIETALKDASNILTIYALSEGMVLGEDSMLSLKEIIEDILKDEKWMLQKKGLETKIDINKSADKFFCSHGEAEMLFKNIIENAIKFTEKGNISIKAVSRGKFIEVSITDTGKGIKKSVQDKVFDRFFKQHKSVEGIGLGLSICREIATRKKGAISIESRGSGKGTTVTVSLPRTKI